MVTQNDESQEERDERQARERIALPLVVPAIVFLFTLLVIYGLSRIYLELDTLEIGDVSMATPLAIGVALAILITATMVAAQPRMSRVQLGSIVMVGVLLLTGGAIWAAVHDEGEVGAHVDGNGNGNGPPPPPPGTISVELVDPTWAVNVEPPMTGPGSVTFSVANAGTILHNFRVIASDDDPGSLPIDDSGLGVDESAVEVVGTIADFPAGETQELIADLEPGNYVLICNVPGHYESGMHAGFAVE